MKKASGSESSGTVSVEDGSKTKVIDVEVCEILVEKVLCLRFISLFNNSINVVGTPESLKKNFI